MNLKAGKIWYESGGNEDANFEWEVGATVDVLTNDGFLVLRIDPKDLIAIADHIIAEEKRNYEKYLCSQELQK